MKQRYHDILEILTLIARNGISLPLDHKNKVICRMAAWINFSFYFFRSFPSFVRYPDRPKFLIHMFMH